MSSNTIRFKDLTVTSTKASAHGTNNRDPGYVLKFTDSKTGRFEYITYQGAHGIENENDLFTALRSVLVTAHYGTMKPGEFCANMMLDPNNPAAEATFLKARGVCKQLDNVVPLDFATRWLDMAKELGHKGLAPRVE